MTVRLPLSRRTACVRSARRIASCVRSAALGSPPSRRNSPSCGVSTTGQAHPRNTSICGAAAFMPSASRTSGTRQMERTACTSRVSSSERPRPGPSSTASISGSRAVIAGQRGHAEPPCLVARERKDDLAPRACGDDRIDFLRHAEIHKAAARAERGLCRKPCRAGQSLGAAEQKDSAVITLVALPPPDRQQLPNQLPVRALRCPCRSCHFRSPPY